MKWPVSVLYIPLRLFGMLLHLQFNKDLEGDVQFSAEAGVFSVPLRCTVKKCDVSGLLQAHLSFWSSHQYVRCNPSPRSPFLSFSCISCTYFQYRLLTFCFFSQLAWSWQPVHWLWSTCGGADDVAHFHFDQQGRAGYLFQPGYVCSPLWRKMSGASWHPRSEPVLSGQLVMSVMCVY